MCVYKEGVVVQGIVKISGLYRPIHQILNFHAGHKIFPEVLEFDPQNPLHKEFLIAAANIYACVFKVHPTKYPSEENKLHIKRPPGSCPSASSGHEGYSYVSVSPDGRLLVAESFVWDMHRLTCKQHVPVTATDMVWTKDGKHLIGPSYSPTPV
ncbi:hypothetical protein PTSG_09680 [Salpingoeca rosetta]|uniref:Ubiquitin-activating enzyme SCCH domain-containing protein n=1 Tax=Salpingoeca rosetta (strain ATCC 50818 / BSB-021) TaxID=946362 RepID=F2ULP3_SALR5|nr:uncharacterized protein PTSG_09680 [Salpingoeca rosetta]EGD78042.1 hypothetical protein PTSG_09680 [Salpingoeca rosetta]|eukprot:XP_004990104.1 hypothetical protein PTSG_09680 [Salpingoeca rosetta]